MGGMEYLASRKEIMSSSIVIGAGWAGLHCAYTLAKAGQSVTLIEAAPQVGGRARSVPFAAHTVDNGQHICIGAYHCLRDLLRELNLDETQLFKILPMEFIAHGKQTLHLTLPNLPPPFNLLCAVLTAKNIAWLDKLQIIKFCYLLHKINFTLEQDCGLLVLFKNYHQSDAIIKQLWEPIVVAAMTTPIQHASAQIFLNILKTMFLNNQRNSDWYIPAADLSAILPMHIENYLLQSGHQIVYGQPIKQLILDKNKCLAVKSLRHSWQADHFVLATSPWQASLLLQPHLITNELHKNLNNFTYEPISTIYFEFPNPVNLKYPMRGLLDTTCHWVFDRTFAGQPNILSAVISASGRHTDLTPADLAAQVLKELQATFPHLGTPIKHRVIKEKRAAFTCSVNLQKYRPTPQTNISNLWLSGDYLQTNLPATLEGALLSGKKTAVCILEGGSDNRGI